MLWGAFGVTLFGLFLTPVFYSVVRRLTDPKAVNPVPPHGPDAVLVRATQGSFHARNGKAEYPGRGLMVTGGPGRRGS
jgi:hypothetical protein